MQRANIFNVPRAQIEESKPPSTKKKDAINSEKMKYWCEKEFMSY